MPPEPLNATSPLNAPNAPRTPSCEMSELASERLKGLSERVSESEYESLIPGVGSVRRVMAL